MSNEIRLWFKLHDARAWKRPEGPVEWDTITPIDIPWLEQSFALIKGDFARWFFSQVLSAEYLQQVSPWGPDFMWCAAAKHFSPTQPSCQLVPMISLHENTRSYTSNKTLVRLAGDMAVAEFKKNKTFSHWMEQSEGYRRFVGGKPMRKIKDMCQNLLRVKNSAMFRLGDCIRNLSVNPSISVGVKSRTKKMLKKKL